MKVQTILDEGDIKELIAKAMKVPIDQVKIDCFMDVVGYGPTEAVVPSIRAIILQDHIKEKNNDK